MVVKTFRSAEKGKCVAVDHNNEKTNKLLQKIIIGFVLLSAIVAFKVFDLGQYLTLSYIKASQERFALLYSEHRLMVILGYGLIYVLATSLSLPGAAVLTLAGGALFGLWRGTLTVSFASSIGATLACIVSRFILRDWVQAKFSDRLKTVNDGIEREGTFYLFTLRLIPIFPFWLINLVMGLTKMPLQDSTGYHRWGCCLEQLYMLMQARNWQRSNRSQEYFPRTDHLLCNPRHLSDCREKDAFTLQEKEVR